MEKLHSLIDDLELKVEKLPKEANWFGNVDHIRQTIKDMRRALQQTDCSTSLPLAQLYSFAETLASGNHEWRYNEKDGRWHKDGWVSRTTDELMQLFPERL